MSIQRSAAKAAARGTLVMFGMRIASFFCTQWTLRSLDPSTLGKASIQLELMLSTALFVSREGFRLALTRNIQDNQPSTWNVAFLTVPCSAVIALIALSLNWSWVPNDDNDRRIAGSLFCLAAFIEGATEPFVLHALRMMNIALKAYIEGAASVVKTATTVLALRYIPGEYAVSAFGIAQLAYAITFFVLFLCATRSNVTMSPPVFIDKFDRKTCQMVAAFTAQGIFKHVLTEGDRIVLATLSDSYNQGVYAMASAYGSLAARMLLQPIEENARLLWSRLVGKDEVMLRESYIVLVKLVLYIGFVFSFFAVNYTSVLLHLLAGRKWGNNEEAASVLSAFCVYTAFMAANGVTEAFVYALSSSANDLGSLTVAHTLIGVVFAMISFISVNHYGTVGLVWANCAAMFLRTLYSLSFAARHFAKQDKTTTRIGFTGLVFKICPHPAILTAFISAFGVTRMSLHLLNSSVANSGNQIWLFDAARHIGAGLLCFVCTVVCIAGVDRDFIRSVRSLVREKRD